MGCTASSKPRSSVAAEPGCYLHEDHALDLKRLISKSSELSAIVDDLKHILPGIQRGLAELNVCLHQAGLGIHAVEATLLCFQREEEEKEKEKNSYRRNEKTKKARTKENAYAETVHKLHEFKLAGDPFVHPNIEELQSMFESLKKMMDALRLRKKEIKESLRSTRWWRKAWNVVFTAVLVGVLVCSVVLAASSVAAPVAVTAAMAGATAIKAVEPWMNSIWEEREKALEGEEDVVKLMCDAGFSVHEFESIRSLVQMLRNDYDALRRDAEFVFSQETEEAIKVGMMDIKKKIENGEVQSGIERLKKKVDGCATEMQRAEAEFLKIIRN